jgi:sugar/nucleoside kinase (ribokinase family)
MADDAASRRSAPAVVTVGAATIDRQYLVTNLPDADGGAFAREVTDTFGGVAANVAVGCARLGRSAGILTRIGTDDIGDDVIDDLRDGPLDLTRVRRHDDTSTHCVILRDSDGRRSIVTAGNSVVRLRLTDEDRAYLADATVVFVTAYAPDPVQQTLLSWADADDFPPVVFDLSGPLTELADRGATEQSIDRWLERAALFAVGDVAAESYFGASGESVAETLTEHGAERAAVTSGEAGACLVSEDDSLTHVPAFDVSVTDETGAGDSYVAGLIHSWLLAERDAETAGRFAAATAALNCTAGGARGNQPAESTVETFLDER